jgi:hypothetical protein
MLCTSCGHNNGTGVKYTVYFQNLSNYFLSPSTLPTPTIFPGKTRAVKLFKATPHLKSTKQQYN